MHWTLYVLLTGQSEAKDHQILHLLRLQREPICWHSAVASRSGQAWALQLCSCDIGTCLCALCLAKGAAGTACDVLGLRSTIPGTYCWELEGVGFTPSGSFSTSCSDLLAFAEYLFQAELCPVCSMAVLFRLGNPVYRIQPWKLQAQVTTHVAVPWRALSKRWKVSCSLSRFLIATCHGHIGSGWFKQNQSLLVLEQAGRLVCAESSAG